jgi:hypothetical protein
MTGGTTFPAFSGAGLPDLAILPKKKWVLCHDGNEIKQEEYDAGRDGEDLWGRSMTKFNGEVTLDAALAQRFLDYANNPPTAHGGAAWIKPEEARRAAALIEENGQHQRGLDSAANTIARLRAEVSSLKARLGLPV